MFICNVSKMRVVFCLMILFRCLGAITASFGQVPVKHALIIANGGYDEVKTQWKKLASANDVPLIESSLKGQKFKPENIKVITDASSFQMTAGLEALVQRVKPGDIVVFHYSGHGVQLQDDNGDEPDGLDEALVPIDAVYDLKELDTGKYLRDDLLGEIFYKVRQKLGETGHLLIFLDSCHSGSGLRGSSGTAARGDKPPLVKSDFKSSSTGTSYSQSVADSPAASRGTGKNLSKMILFAGASSNESNYETYMDGKSVGSLSFAISKVISQLTGDDTYRQFFAKIRSEMAIAAPRQSPVIEGDINFKLFAGDSKKQEPYVELKKRLSQNTVELKAGSVSGISMGDAFVLDTAGKVRQPGERHIFAGEITDVGFFSSTITFKNTLPADFSPAGYWAYCTKPSFRNTSISLGVDIPKQTLPNYKRLVDSLSTWPFVQLVAEQKASDLQLKSEGTASVFLELSDSGLPFMDMKPIGVKAPAGIAEFKKALLAFAQARFLKSLQLKSDDIRVELSLVRVKATVENDDKFTIQQLYDSPSDTVTRIFSEKDQFFVKVTNLGKVRAFYNIVAIQPDSKITAVVPAYGSSDANSYSLNPGESRVIKTRLLNGFFPPFGTEMLKLFATSKPIDLFPIIDFQESMARSGEINSVEMIMESYRRTTRGPRMSAANNTGATSDYVYTIVPPSQ